MCIQTDNRKIFSIRFIRNKKKEMHLIAQRIILIYGKNLRFWHKIIFQNFIHLNDFYAYFGSMFVLNLPMECQKKYIFFFLNKKKYDTSNLQFSFTIILFHKNTIHCTWCFSFDWIVYKKKKKNHTNFKISYIVGKWLNSKNFFLLKNIEKSYVSNSYISF